MATKKRGRPPAELTQLRKENEALSKDLKTAQTELDHEYAMRIKVDADNKDLRERIEMLKGDLRQLRDDKTRLVKVEQQNRYLLDILKASYNGAAAHVNLLQLAMRSAGVFGE